MASSSPRVGADDNPHERQRAAEAADALALLSDRGFDPMQGEEFEELRGELQRAQGRGDGTTARAREYVHAAL